MEFDRFEIIACPHCGKRIPPTETGKMPSNRTELGDAAALKALKEAHAQAVGGTCSD